LLKAFARAFGGRKVQLLVVGQTASGYGQRLRRMIWKLGIADQVSLLFDLSPDQIPLVYRASDIFVTAATTLSEIFGLSILEAMASGIPVVAPDFDGFREVVVPGRTGVLVETRWMDSSEDIEKVSLLKSNPVLMPALNHSILFDPDQLMEEVSRLAGAHEARSAMGEEARKLVEERYTWKRAIASYTEHWEKVHADAVAGAPDPRANFLEVLRPSYFRNFHGFVTSPVSADEQIVHGPRFRDLMATKKKPRVDARFRAFISLRIVSEILRASKKPVSIQRTVHDVGNKLTVPDSRVRYHISWLIREGYLVLLRE
jgi:hypothetical protein